MLEAVEPLGVLERDLEHGVSCERQPVAAGRQTDHAVPGGVATGALGEYPRRQLVLRLERPYLAAVLVQEACGGRAKRVGYALRHLGVG